jgi:hypothetical protein
MKTIARSLPGFVWWVIAVAILVVWGWGDNDDTGSEDGCQSAECWDSYEPPEYAPGEGGW